MSDDVLAAIKSIKKLAVKVVNKKGVCKIYGVGMNGYNYKKSIVLNAKNSGTLGRLIAGILIGLSQGAATIWFPEATNVVIYVMMGLTIIFRPQGLFGVR